MGFAIDDFYSINTLFVADGVYVLITHNSKFFYQRTILALLN